jgi:hypothetical protein
MNEQKDYDVLKQVTELLEEVESSLQYAPGRVDFLHLYGKVCGVEALLPVLILPEILPGGEEWRLMNSLQQTLCRMITNYNWIHGTKKLAIVSSIQCKAFELKTLLTRLYGNPSKAAV